MKSLIISAVFLLTSAALFAQNRSGFVSTGNVSRTGSSVVMPAGTSAAPGVQRTAGSVIYPGGGGPQIGIPSAITNLNFPSHVGTGVRGTGARGNARQGGAFVYSYPVFVGGGFWDSSYGAQPQPQAAPEQPNVVVVYPQQQPPVIINVGTDAAYAMRVQPQNVYPMQAAPAPAQDNADAAEPTRFLIAFKDHSIYSAVAYWVDGDTLHYFTTGNTHNQASVALVDRELTDRLNKESGNTIKLPPAK